MQLFAQMRIATGNLLYISFYIYLEEIQTLNNSVMIIWINKKIFINTDQLYTNPKFHSIPVIGSMFDNCKTFKHHVHNTIESNIHTWGNKQTSSSECGPL